MPITLEKLFSPTVKASFTFLGEQVNIVWAPFRYTGEMQELSDRMMEEHESDTAAVAELKKVANEAIAKAIALEAEVGGPELIAALRAEAAAAQDELGKQEVTLDSRDKAFLREVVSKLLVSWDVLDGKTPLPTDLATLKRLPDIFVRAVFVNMSNESQSDPLSALTSDEPSNTGRGSARSQAGTNTSKRRVRSTSPRSSSTNGRTARGGTRSGASGHSSSNTSSPPSPS